MASTITSAAVWPSNRNAQVGPFEDGNGNLYVFLIDTTNSLVEAWKSSNGGTSWAEQDAGASLQPGGSGGSADSPNGESLYAQKLGDSVYVSWDGSAGTTTITPHVAQFNMSSASSGADTWIDDSIATPNTFADSLAIGTFPQHYLAVMSNGDMVLFTSSSTEMVMGTERRRIEVQRYLGSVWGNQGWPGDATADQNGTAAHFDTRGILVGDGRVHLFYTRDDSNFLQHRSFVPSTGSFGSIEDLTGVTEVDETRTYAVGLPKLRNTEIVVPFVEPTSADMQVLRATSAATIAGTAATTEVDVRDPEDFFANYGVAVDGAGEVWAVFADDTDQDLYYKGDGGDNSWPSTPTELEDTVTANGVSAMYCPINGIIGVAWFDISTAKFSSFAAGGGGGSLPPVLHPLARTRVLTR